MSDPKPSFAPADLVASLRRTAGELASMVAELPAGEVTGSRGTDWSAAELIAHLAHFEVLAGARIRMVLTLDRPPLASFDQEEFNRRFADLLRPDTALALFQVNRGVNCDLLGLLVAADWGRLGVHPVRGEETLARSMEMLARHDREHLDQLRRALTAQQFLLTEAARANLSLTRALATPPKPPRRAARSGRSRPC